MRIGHFRRAVDVAHEYRQLATQDEHAANLLMRAGQSRPAAYFVIQAIEKYLRSKIFSIVDGKNEYFRQRNRNHSVEDAVAFLVEVISPDPLVRQQIKAQLESFITGDVQFNHLHNDIRYPTYFDRDGCYSCLELNQSDTDKLFAKLEWVKQFVKSI